MRLTSIRIMVLAATILALLPGSAQAAKYRFQPKLAVAVAADKAAEIACDNKQAYNSAPYGTDEFYVLSGKLGADYASIVQLDSLTSLSFGDPESFVETKCSGQSASPAKKLQNFSFTKYLSTLKSLYCGAKDDSSGGPVADGNAIEFAAIHARFVKLYKAEIARGIKEAKRKHQSFRPPAVPKLSC